MICKFYGNYRAIDKVFENFNALLESYELWNYNYTKILYDVIINLNFPAIFEYQVYCYIIK